MLDRNHIQRNVSRTQSVDAIIDPVGEVMVSGLRAVGALKAVEYRPKVAKLSRDDDSLRVREAALRTLELLGSATASALSQG